MNISLTAFRVAFSRIGEEQAKAILHKRGGTKELKTIIVAAAIGDALRKMFDDEALSVSGREFYEAEDFIFNYFPGALDAQITRVPRGVVLADCNLRMFQQKDIVTLQGGLLFDPIALSVESQVYKVFADAVQHYLEFHRGDLNALVVAVDCVHDAVSTTCRELAAYLALLRRGGGASFS